jgi:hypothetical protein
MSQFMSSILKTKTKNLIKNNFKKIQNTPIFEKPISSTIEYLLVPQIPPTIAKPTTPLRVAGVAEALLLHISLLQFKKLLILSFFFNL